MAVASASRPISISQRGLSGIGRRTSANTTEGKTPVANIQRQPVLMSQAWSPDRATK
jgi:hypothetical protein